MEISEVGREIPCVPDSLQRKALENQKLHVEFGLTEKGACGERKQGDEDRQTSITKEIKVTGLTSFQFLIH